MSAVAIIPARGGSRRLPGKNVKPFFGKPVIAYSILAAARAGFFSKIVVSTDSGDIASIAREFGADVVGRRPEMALDETGTQEVTRDALDILYGQWQPAQRPEYACCIYPCAPTLLPEDLQEALTKLESAPCTYVMVPGLFYLGRTQAFLESIPLEGNSIELRWNERHIDINEIEDFHRAAAVYLRMTMGGA